jgi:Ni,Fe-hydrogenase III large subunit
MARALVRWREVQASLDFLQQLSLPEGELWREVGALAPSHLAVSLVEGWRGAVCHLAVTDDEGRFGRYQIVDPSLFNWPGLALAMRGQEISDFPLCNKSFNLSYCGHDL